MAAHLRETLPALTAPPSTLNKPASIGSRSGAVLAHGWRMPGIILLAVLGTVAYRLTTAAQRKRFLKVAFNVARELTAAAIQRRPESDAFRDRLRARTPYLVVTPTFAAINVAVAVGMLFAATPFNDSATLLAWGASVGPLTTNGQWWRLVTSTFVNTGTLQLLINVAMLSQLGAVLERLVGPLAFGAVYVSAGVFAALISLSSHPVSVSVGPSAAVLALYGLLIALFAWQLWLQRGGDPDSAPDRELGQEPDAESISVIRTTMPLVVIKRLGCGFGIFIVFTTLNGLAGAAEAGGLLVGLGYGLALGWSVVAQRPRIGHVAAAIVASAMIAIACALPLRNIADVKPEIAGAIAAEERTSAAYQSALDAFKKGHLTAGALAELAERTNVSTLQAVDARLEALRNVPPEYRPLVNDAREYLRLRCQSWRLRAAAIRRTDATLHRAHDRTADASSRFQAETRFRSDMVARGNAEGAERASLDAFQRIRPILQ
jgi:membrane associated rhomboid family serine protease